jgi:hypothetical protein
MGTSRSSGDWDEVKRNKDHWLCKIYFRGIRASHIWTNRSVFVISFREKDPARKWSEHCQLYNNNYSFFLLHKG